jgi:crotonobetainyl-CoA:carnitine CoA-transferase CaiB-like acyl-CoA transferase
VNDYESAVREPQVVENEYVTTLKHPLLGTVGVVGSPIRMSAHECRPRATAPELGQHTEEVLLEAGYGWEEIARFRDCGAI